MFIIYYQQFSAISLVKRVVMYYIYLYVQILCYLSSQESNQLFIYMYHNSINAASEASEVSIIQYVYIPDERGTLVTSELQCPSVSDDHKSICCILYIGRARRPSGSGASIVLLYNICQRAVASVYIQSYRSQIGNKNGRGFSIS